MMASFENETKTSQFLSDLILAIIQRKKVEVGKDLNMQCRQLAEIYNLQALTRSGDVSTILSELEVLKEELLQARKTIKANEETIASHQSIITHQAEMIKLQEQDLDSKDKEIDSLSQFKEEAFQLVKKYSN